MINQFMPFNQYLCIFVTGEDRIGYLLEDVQKCDPSRNATQWGPLSDPITSFDLVSEKLVSR